MKVTKRDLIEGLSYALDVADRSYVSHSKHVAYICINIAIEMNFSKDEQKNIYYAGLLHDIGISTPYSLIEHCKHGRDLVSNLPINKLIPKYIHYHHEKIDGSGPFKLKGNEIPIQAKILSLANSFDINFRGIKNITLNSLNEILDWLNHNRNFFDENVIKAFKRSLNKEYFLLNYSTSDFNTIIREEFKIPNKYLTFDEIEKFSKTFAKIIDSRNRFTYEHSVGVMKLAHALTIDLGYDIKIQNEICIAALLHDIGKLMIPNEILNKNTKLTPEEFYKIKKHPYYTKWILKRIKGFENITNYAYKHHEKLNGKGYPYHLNSDHLNELERILAISDIYQALTEKRPYKNAMSKKNAFEIMEKMAINNEIDMFILNSLKSLELIN